MKAEHRKELETNALAEGMGRMIRGIKVRPKGRSVLYWVLGLSGVAAVFAFFWLRGVRKEDESDSWRQIDIATEISTLAKIGYEAVGTKEKPIKTEQGRAARYQVAWFWLQDHGIKILLVSPDYAIKRIHSARAIFEELATETKKDHIWGPEAVYAQAVAEETLAVEANKADEQLGKALELYNQVVKDFEHSALAKKAAIRVKELENEDEKRRISTFYVRLGQQVEDRRFFQRMQQKMPGKGAETP